jgi:D-alanine-D-alanine ligase
MVTRIAVFFGGRSPEHDVSIKTGLQALSALDQRLYEGFPVYIGLDGEWWVGDALRKDANYIPLGPALGALTPVALEARRGKPGGRLVGTAKRGFLSKPPVFEFDVALLALHGLNGEDGRLQGLLEMNDVPYTGMRTMSAGLAMDKGATKHLMATAHIPLLPFAVIDRPVTGLIPTEAEIAARLAGFTYPLIVKPTHLGSSIGLARVGNVAELRAVLPAIFQLDTQAVVERLVENLIEYNISVSAFGGAVCTSAIETPKSAGELLDFKQKYLSGSGKGKGAKTRASSEGMLSLTREINPDLPPEADANIRRWASSCFTRIGLAGAPRIDFLSDRITGEIWLNEINPCPGSFAFYLWDAAADPVRFPELLGHLITEALTLHDRNQLPADPVPAGARLFNRP